MAAAMVPVAPVAPRPAGRVRIVAQDGSRAARLARALAQPDLTTLSERFPVPALLVAGLAVSILLGQYDVAGFGRVQDRLAGALVAAGLAALVSDLYWEGQGRAGRHSRAAALVPALLIGLLHAAPAPWRPLPLLLIPALAIAVGLAGFAGRHASLDRFWRFNQRIWLSAGLAFLGAFVFALGIFAIDRSLDVLFGVDFERLVWNAVFPLAFCLLAPLYWLSAMPRSDQAGDLAPNDFIDKAVRLIARFVLAPLLFVYALILFAYALRIVLLGELPRGQVGWMVGAFGSVGALSVLVLYPERAGGRLVGLFWRWWFAATIVPVVLLAMAIYERIGQYGLTEPRYVLVVITVWLGAMAALFVRPSFERDIRLIAASLAVLLLLASFGPWGAAGATIASQTAAFRTLAEAQGWYQDGRLDAERIRAGGRTEEHRRARSILVHLARYDALPEGGEGEAAAAGLLALAGPDRSLRSEIRSAFGLAQEERRTRRAIALAPPGTAVDISGFEAMYGPLILRRAGQGEEGLSLAGSVLAATLPDGVRAQFDLGAALAEGDDGPELPALLLSTQADGARTGLLVLDWAAFEGEAGLEVTSLRAFLLHTPGG